MDEQRPHIFIIAGEASGDMHAAHLVDAIKEKRPDATFSGLGGERMQQSGVNIYHDMTKMAVIGFWEVLKHYGDIKKIFHTTVKKIKETRPDCVILVDYPGFNMRLAKALKKHKIKVIYYISPQVWAWKKNRVFQVKKYVDKMLVIFKFEKDFYAQFGVDVSFVGHPLTDTINVNIPKEEFLKTHQLEKERSTIGLLPGSREKEIHQILPPMLEAATLLKKEFPILQFLLIKAPGIDARQINEILEKYDLNITIIEEDRYNAINACDLCMVASGTATLETAILQKPMVVVYKTSFFTWFLAKLFVKIPDIGLVNVVASKRIVPECVQFQAKGKNIAEEMRAIFKDEIKIAQIKNELAQVKQKLEVGNASQKTSDTILEFLKINPLHENRSDS